MSDLAQFKNFPKEWNVLPFLDAVKDVTGGNTKIKQSDACEIGIYPVIDQGQQACCGYVNEDNALCKEELPTVLFGDHTRIIKIIDHPFVLGADGVKVLSPKVPMDKKFLFYFLNTIKLPDNAGYSRHYKFLKEAVVPVPPLAEQKRIAAILDKADSLRRKNQQAIQLADQFLRAVFLDMFGDPVTNLKGFPVGTIRDLTESANYGTSAKASETEGEFPILRMGNITYQGGWDFSNLKYIDLSEKDEPKYLARKGDLLFNRTNSKELVGKTAVFEEETPMAIAGYLIRVRPNEKGNTYYISGYLNSTHGKKTLLNMCKSIVGMANINAQELQDIKMLIPPIKLQNKYEQIVLSTKRRLKKLAASEIASEQLFGAISQKAFAGEL